MIADNHPHDRVIDGVGDCQSENIDALGCQRVAYRGERSRLVRQEQRELGYDFHSLSLRY